MAFDLSKQIYTNIDPKAMDLLRKMLAANPNQRISAKLALKHSYFEGVEVKGASSPSPTLGSQNKKWFLYLRVNLIDDMTWLM